MHPSFCNAGVSRKQWVCSSISINAKAIVPSYKDSIRFNQGLEVPCHLAVEKLYSTSDPAPASRLS